MRHSSSSLLFSPPSTLAITSFYLGFLAMGLLFGFLGALLGAGLEKILLPCLPQDLACQARLSITGSVIGYISLGGLALLISTPIRVYRLWHPARRNHWWSVVLSLILSGVVLIAAFQAFPVAIKQDLPLLMLSGALMILPLLLYAAVIHRFLSLFRRWTQRVEKVLTRSLPEYQIDLEM